MKKNYFCEIHNKESYISYCKKCKRNLCIFCENQHNNHEIILYRKIFPNKENKKRN